MERTTSLGVYVLQVCKIRKHLYNVGVVHTTYIKNVATCNVKLSCSGNTVCYITAIFSFGEFCKRNNCMILRKGVMLYTVHGRAIIVHATRLRSLKNHNTFWMLLIYRLN